MRPTSNVSLARAFARGRSSSVTITFPVRECADEKTLIRRSDEFSIPSILITLTWYGSRSYRSSLMSVPSVS